jgi:hypothetical protein
MAKIKNTERYPKDVLITENDFVIGTDGDQNNRTKNFPVSAIAEYVFSTIKDLDQNNKIVELQALQGLNSVFSNIQDAVNNSTIFTVSSSEIYVISNTYTVQESAGSFAFRVEWWMLKSGKGTYGLNSGTTTTSSDFFFLRAQQRAQLLTTSNLPPKVEFITTITDIAFPSIAVNSSSSSYEIINNRDTYFVIRSRFIDPSQGSVTPSRTYRFIGDVGTYGQGGLTTVEGDFLLVEDESNPSNTTTPRAVNILLDSITDLTAVNVQEALQQLSERDDNFSRTIYINNLDLDGVAGATIEDQIVNYVNQLNYDKQTQDSEVWIDYSEVAAPETINAFGGIITIS